MIKHGRIRGERVRYPDGEGCCIWEPMPREDGTLDEDCGICFDFVPSDIPDMLNLLQELWYAEPTVTAK